MQPRALIYNAPSSITHPPSLGLRMLLLRLLRRLLLQLLQHLSANCLSSTHNSPAQQRGPIEPPTAMSSCPAPSLSAAMWLSDDDASSSCHSPLPASAFLLCSSFTRSASSGLRTLSSFSRRCCAEEKSRRGRCCCCCIDRSGCGARRTRVRREVMVWWVGEVAAAFVLLMLLQCSEL